MEAPGSRAAREITYAGEARTRAGRLTIAAIEALTGRPRLLRMARGYEDELAAGDDLFEVMARRYGLRLALDDGALDRMPAAGPLLVVANHPYGVLDGLALGLILRRRRPDAKIVAHAVFRRAPELADTILPVAFGDGREAQAANLATRRAARDHLAAGGCVAMFPGGTVSTARTPFGVARDPSWRNFASGLIRRAQPSVTPIFFEGANSRLFQIASHLHPTLRYGLLIREFGRARRRPLVVRIGAAIPAAALVGPDAMARLRAATYALADPPLADISAGLDLG